MRLLTPTNLTLGLSFLLLLSLSACQQVKFFSSRPAPLPQDPFIEVYFNHSEASEYVEPYRQQKRSGDDLEQKIVETIATAKSTVDVAVQELRLPKIAQALAERQQAGVKVRVIIENTYHLSLGGISEAAIAQMPERERSRYEELRKLIDRDRNGELSPAEINQGDALVILQNAGIPILDDTADGSAGSGLMHHKFVIVDDSKLIVTSANFTTSDIHGDFRNSSSRGNANNLLKIDSFELANIFTQEFNLMWGDGPGGLKDSKFGLKKPFRPAQLINLLDSNVTIQFSPTSAKQPWEASSNGLIGKALNNASQSVNLALFVFSEQQLGNILETNHQKGVQIKALIDPDFAYRSYSEALDMMGVALGTNCKYEPQNNPWQSPINTVGVPQLLKGDLLHHKFAVIDGQTVIAGSHNWSTAANKNNDETLLIIQNSRVAAHFEREFARLYQNAQLGIPPSLQEKIDQQNKTCR